MSLRITVRAGKVSFDVELEDSPVATQLDRWIPFQAESRLWGEDLYFSLPGAVEGGEASLTRLVGRGDVAYCPHDATLRLYFGRTPFSPMERPVPHYPVFVIGHVIGDYQRLQEIEEHARLEIVRATRVTS